MSWWSWMLLGALAGFALVFGAVGLAEWRRRRALAHVERVRRGY